MPDEIEETRFFRDDVQTITDILRDEWSLDIMPVISYDQEGLIRDARLGYIFVYNTSNYGSISSTDYRTIQKTTYLGIRISCRARAQIYNYVNEVYRILMKYRRAGFRQLNDTTFFEVTGYRLDQGELGWYSASMDIKMVGYTVPIKSDGFGNPLNIQN